jgi:nucleoside-diphosphate-sugar epimerase
MKFLVFGATGMLGSMFCKVASQAGHSVLAVDREQYGHFDRIEKLSGVQTKTYSDFVTEKNNIVADVGLDFAWIGTNNQARMDADIQVQNVDLFLQNIQIAQQSGVFRYVAVGSVYEEFETTPYAFTKKYLRKIGKLYAEQNQIELIWGQIFSLYGPNAFQGGLLNSMLKGEVKQIKSGNQVWNWINTFDAAQAFLTIATANSARDHYWIADPQTHTLGYYVEIVNQFLPAERTIKIGDGRGNTDIPTPDVTPLLELGWKPNYTFEQGIAELLKKP